MLTQQPLANIVRLCDRCLVEGAGPDLYDVDEDEEEEGEEEEEAQQSHPRHCQRGVDDLQVLFKVEFIVKYTLNKLVFEFKEISFEKVLLFEHF